MTKAIPKKDISPDNYDKDKPFRDSVMKFLKQPITLPGEEGISISVYQAIRELNMAMSDYHTAMGSDGKFTAETSQKMSANIDDVHYSLEYVIDAAPRVTAIAAKVPDLVTIFNAKAFATFDKETFEALPDVLADLKELFKTMPRLHISNGGEIDGYAQGRANMTALAEKIEQEYAKVVEPLIKRQANTCSIR